MLQENFTNFQNIQCIRKYLVFGKVESNENNDKAVKNVIKYDTKYQCTFIAYLFGLNNLKHEILFYPTSSLC